MRTYNYIRFFNTLSLQDIGLVGGKNASLGQMVQHVSTLNIRVPKGYAVTVDGYWHFIKTNKLKEQIDLLLEQLHGIEKKGSVQELGNQLRSLILNGSIPLDLEQEIVDAYHFLSQEYASNAIDVAVRSSATAEDLPVASFAGQQESYLNIVGAQQVLHAYQECLASLFTDRALTYRKAKGFDRTTFALSVGIQKMIRADRACAGVAFSLDTESGFQEVIQIEVSYGLGEVMVQGQVDPDCYTVFKPMLAQGYDAIIGKKLGTKKVQLVYADNAAFHTRELPVSVQAQQRFCLEDHEIKELALMVQRLELFYTQQAGRWTPLDIEWAKDGVDGALYIVQARPETVHARMDHTHIKQYELGQHMQKPVLEGLSIGQHITTGSICIIKSLYEAAHFKKGDILVTHMTDPDWIELMRQAAGIITDLGGRTCHAAIVARELGIPALIGTQYATTVLAQGQEVTIDCSKGSVGKVYQGKIPYAIQTLEVDHLHKPPVSLLVNMADPSRAFSVAQLPHVDGVGLARLEFIIASQIKIHPMACLEPEKISDAIIRNKIEQQAGGYASLPEFFINTLAQGVATIAAAFWPRVVLVRFSDFKSNEYANLLGGSYFEPDEENPMLGLRGASRYDHPLYAPAFALEVAALKKVRNQMGLTNVAVMIPFVRTVQEAQQIIALLNQYGLHQGQQGLKIFMMVEVPSNVILLEQFCALFDGFSIGSNDLTQFTLAVDRDSSLLAVAFDERDPAVKELMRIAIAMAHKHKKYIGICGQAPSDYPELGKFLIEQGINSLSLNPDAVIPFLLKK